MFVLHTLVATPVTRRFRVQASSPASDLSRTAVRPRRSSLTTEVPSMLTSGVTLPRRRSSAARASSIRWPLVKSWK